MLSRLPKSKLVPLAFASVYFFWGSTYLAIHVAGEHLSAPVVSAARTLVAAVMIGTMCLASGKGLRVPRGEGWKLVVVGVLFMSVNNMMLTWGEQMVASGMASLIIATIPIMVALIEMTLPGGDALNARGWVGTITGTLGIVVLLWPSLHGYAATGVHTRPIVALFVLLTGALAFAIGSVMSRRYRFRADTLVATGWQLAAAGVFNAAVVCVSGGLHHAVWTWQGAAAILYLAFFGSLFGLVAFTYLLQNVPVTKVATYAFVNPIIAVLLGMAILGERLVKVELVGMAIIVGSVAMVVLSRKDGTKGEIAERDATEAESP